MDWIGWLVIGGAGAFVGLAGVVYIGLPLLVMTQLEMDLRRVHALDDDAEAFPGELRLADRVEALGFVRIGSFEASLVGNVPSTMSLLIMPDGKHGAMVTRMQPENMPLKQYLEFSTDLEDGGQVCTSNADELETIGEGSDKHAIHLPEVEDPAALLAIHRKRVDHIRRGVAIKPAPLDLSAIDYFRYELRKEMDRKVAAGGWTAHEDGQVYKPTPRSIFPMVWGELPPFKQWRRWRSMANRARVMREFGPKTA